MDYTSLIQKLYSGVLEREKSEYSVEDATVKQGMEDMAEAYKRYRYWQLRLDAKMVDYNNAAHRCAYLHKYAMLHTKMVTTVLQSAFKQDTVKESINSKESLSLCSLGGGPGTDIVALLLVLQEVFGPKECSASILDYSVGWQHTFASVVSALRGLTESDVSGMVDESRFKHQYLGADLLEPSTFDDTEAHAAIRNADILTMVKFVSAAACHRTGQMLEKIFQTMKPGSMLLFIDNAGGWFHEVVKSKAETGGLQTVFGPIAHLSYSGSFFSFLYGCTRQYKIKVTIEMWRQPLTKPESPIAPEADESLMNLPGLSWSGESDEEFMGEETADESCCESSQDNSVKEESSDESAEEELNDESCSQFVEKNP